MSTTNVFVRTYLFGVVVLSSLTSVALLRAYEVPTKDYWSRLVTCHVLDVMVATISGLRNHDGDSNESVVVLPSDDVQVNEIVPLFDNFSKREEVMNDFSEGWPFPSFDANKSTELNYKLPSASDDIEYAVSGNNLSLEVLEQSKYASLRKTLDYSYHSVYQPNRQAFQDRLVESLLQQKTICRAPGHPTWIVFTAGAMGAGKTHTLAWLQRKGRFPLHNFVWVDPDYLRRLLPEYHIYLRQQAGEQTRKEAGLLTELLTAAALRDGRPVVVDGTLRDYQWYQNYFDLLRRTHPGLKIAILHITAPPEAVLERAKHRAKITGRVVPEKLLQEVMTQVPKSVKILREKADVFVELYNGITDDEIQLVDPTDMTWEEFSNLWQCPKDAS